MTYCYFCAYCGTNFEKHVRIAERDDATRRPCPVCRKKKVERIVEAAAISYDGAVSDIRRAGSGWNDVLKKISKSSGRKSMIDHY